MDGFFKDKFVTDTFHLELKKKKYIYYVLYIYNL